ncbi:serine/threonine protein kinase, partial [Chloroflexota bacterium]
HNNSNFPESYIKIGSRVDSDLTVIDHLGGTRKVDIYLCRSRNLKRLVACKLLLPRDRKKKTDRDALIKEGQILQKLRHPNVIEGYGVFLEPYTRIVIEYLQGQNLNNTFFKGNYSAFDINDIVDVALQLSDALSYIHEQGFLHLDVKPSNIFYCDGHIKLFDFGLAQQFSLDNPLIHRAGTLEYMAPEQTFKMPLTYATDVFGLGVTFYQLIARGKRPFKIKKHPDKKGMLKRQSDYESLIMAPSKLNSAISYSIERVAMKAICPDIQERFQSPAEFHEALVAAIKS